MDYGRNIVTRTRCALRLVARLHQPAGASGLAPGAGADAVRALSARVGHRGDPRARGGRDQGGAAYGPQAARAGAFRRWHPDAPCGQARARRSARPARSGRCVSRLEPRMRWWGWGVDRDAMRLPEGARALIEGGLGVKDAPAPRVDLDAIELLPSRLDAATRQLIESIVGPDNVRDDQLTRVAHAAGRSYPDLLHLRAGQVAGPDAVAFPAGHDEVRALLEACSEAAVAVVPFGGGTSVVGGVDPDPGPFAAVVAVDLARVSGLIEVDEVSLLARVAAGTTGPELEAALGGYGLTLGHLPQSWEYITIGGAVATRSAGQASTGYGRIDKQVLGLRLAAPAGEIEVHV